MPDLDYIRNLISEGKVKEALTDLLKLLESNDRKTRKLRDGVIILHSKFQDLSRKESLGLIESDDALREKGQINDGLLSIINDFETNTPVPEPVTQPQMRKQFLWWLLLLIPVALVAVFWDKLFPGGESSEQVSPVPDTSQVGPAGPQQQPAELHIESWTWTPDPVIKGRSAKVHFDIKNTGAGPASNVEVEWWADTREPIPTKMWTLNLLRGGEVKTFDISQTWPATAPDVINARIRVDPKHTIAGDDPVNNAWEKTIALQSPSAPPTRSDLWVTIYRWSPDPVQKGQPVSLSFEITNGGPDPARNFDVEWWSNAENTKASQTWTVTRLNPGERKKFELEHVWPVRPGTNVNTQIVLDPTNRVRDNNRQNNTLQRMVPLRDPPAQHQNCDVAVRAWQWYPNPVVLGQETDVMFDIVNTGPDEARKFTVYWYATAATTSPTQRWPVDLLPAGERKSFEFKYKWSANTPLPLKFKVVIDPERRLADDNRSNNEKLVEVRVQPVTGGGGVDGGTTAGTVRDTRDGKAYKTVKIGGKTWLAENLNAATEGSWCSEDNPQNCNKYGRLYTWEAATTVCNRLGSGWRLPTYNDWQSLIDAFGGRASAETYPALMAGGKSGFNALLGGHRLPDGTYSGKAGFGEYWRNTPPTQGNYTQVTFTRVANNVNFVFVPIEQYRGMAYSCRCVKD